MKKIRLLFVLSTCLLAGACETTYYLNGDKYVGELKSLNRQGKGTYYYSNGDVFEGEFVNNHRHGPGTLTFANGKNHRLPIERKAEA